MVGIYKIKNQDKSTDTQINEILILLTIKSLKGRNKDIVEKWINVWEELEKTKFSKKQLE